MDCKLLEGRDIILLYVLLSSASIRWSHIVSSQQTLKLTTLIVIGLENNQQEALSYLCPILNSFFCMTCLSQAEYSGSSLYGFVRSPKQYVFIYLFIFPNSFLKMNLSGRLGGSVIKRLPSAQVMIPGSWD